MSNALPPPPSTPVEYASPVLCSSLPINMPRLYYRYFVESRPRVFEFPPGSAACSVAEFTAHLAAECKADLRHVRFVLENTSATEEGPRERLSSVRDQAVLLRANMSLIVRRAPRRVPPPITADGGIIVR